MTFGEAIEAMKAGNRVARKTWAGTEMWLRLRQPDRDSKITRAYVLYESHNGDSIPWAPSHFEILAEDRFVPELASAHSDDVGTF